MTGPLQGIVVTDLTRALAGPYCTMMLGDMGAEIIKIEMPGPGDETRAWGPPFVQGQSSYFMSVNRNKKSVTLDLKHPLGKEVLERLLHRSDVLVENFRPGVMESLGFAYTQARESFPRLVYCSISGFGQTGPRSREPAYDQTLQGMGGLMSLTGPVGGPPTKVGVAIADIAAGMFAAFAIAAALYRRQTTGTGEWIDASMLAGQVALLTFQAGRYFATGEPPTWMGNQHPSIVPYDTFAMADGYVNVAAGNDALWERCCRALGLDSLLQDSRFQTNPKRVEHRQELTPLIQERLRHIPTSRALELLAQAGVPCGPIYDLREVFNDAQARHLGLRREVPHPSLGTVHTTAPPYRLEVSALADPAPPPLLSQHTEQVLSWLGYSAAEQQRLHQLGAMSHA